MANDKLLETIIQKHAPWIKQQIKALRATGKISSQFEDQDLSHAGYNGIVEALATYDKDKGTFENHAKYRIKMRIKDFIKDAMQQQGAGGVDQYHLNQARKRKRQNALEEAQKVPKLKEEVAAPEAQPVTESSSEVETPPPLPKP